MFKQIILLSVMFVFGVVSESSAIAEDLLSPMQLVRETIQKVRQTVVGQQNDLSESQLFDALEQIIFPVFSFDEMSRRCIGQHWKKGTPPQQKEFMSLFSELLSRTYLKRIRDVEHSDVSFVSEKITGKRALVKTIVDLKGDEIPINYRMRVIGNDWRVYDVVVENISLVSNYRNEFAGIVRKEEFSGLLQRLREKKAQS